MNYNDRRADFDNRRRGGLARRAAVTLTVEICSIPREHEYHVCKPGGSAPWLCPGRGPQALEHAIREPAPFGAVRA